MDCKVTGIVQDVQLPDMQMHYFLRIHFPRAASESLIEVDEQTVQQVIAAAVGGLKNDGVSVTSQDVGETYFDAEETEPQEDRANGAEHEAVRLFAKTMETASADIFGGTDSQMEPLYAEPFRAPPPPPVTAPPPPPVTAPPPIAAVQQMNDRSGVPSRTLPVSMVDEKGNPIVRGSAPIFYDEDEGIGEQI